MALSDYGEKKFVYDHIPSLREVMPRTGGIPGVIYKYIAVHNARTAQDEGWDEAYGLSYFTISMDGKSVDCCVGVKGRPIPGISSSDGRPRLLVDNDIALALGLVEHETPPVEDTVPTTSPAIKESGIFSGDTSVKA